MSSSESYIEGIRLYSQGNYAAAGIELSSCANAGDLAGRIARLFLARCYWRNAWLAWDNNMRPKAAGHLAAASEFSGKSVELGRFLCRYYHAGRTPASSENARKKAHSSAIDMLMAAYDAINSRPTSSQFQMLAGLALCRQDKWDQAAEHFNRAAELDKSDPQPLRKLGLCKAVEGNFAAAAEDLSDALRLAPGDLTIAKELFSAAAAANSNIEIKVPENAGSPDEQSLDQLRDVQLGESDFIDCFLSLPPSEADAEIFTVALGFMQRALAMHGDYADMQLKTAAVYQRIGDKQKAIEHGRRALEINPRYIQAHYLLGSLLMESDLRQAAAHLSQAVACGGDYADIRADLGLACKRLGWTQRAREQFNRSLDINNNYEKARENLHALGA